MNRKKRAKFRAVAIGAFAVAASIFMSAAAACSVKDDDTDETDKVVTKLDSQIIKNGNFEFYNDNDGLYPISSPDNWTSGIKGASSSSMSGIINTRKDRWDYITDKTLPQTLEDNDDLDSKDENKKDYNGALTDDLPYVNTHEATKSDAEEEDKEYIANPFTHKYRYDEDGIVRDNEGNEVKTYVDEDGNYFLDEDFETEFETSVLMLHNYRSSYYTGTESYYRSSSTITLEASTACEISVWVKTCNLTYDGSKAESTPVAFDRGAYIQVNTSVGSNSLDAIKIKNINTEKLNTTGDDNGWVQYTVYIEACTFASTTVTLTLGLGEDSKYTVEGYAFFDDVTYTKYLNRAELEEESAAFSEKIRTDGSNTTHPLSPDEPKHEFRTDREIFTTNGTGSEVIEQVREHNSADRHFFIDFASTSVGETLALDNTNVKAGLTVERTSTGKFISSKQDIAGNLSGVSLLAPSGTVYLPTKLTGDGIETKDDMLTLVNIGKDWQFDVKKNDAKYEYADLLTEKLKSAATLPGVNGSAATLVMVSAYGAAYEAEITNEKFTLSDGDYALISFWLKTSQMNGKTAATVTAIDLDDDKNSTNFSVDTTTVTTTTIGDVEDVYDGWVKCFVRVSNTSGKNGMRFKLKVNFGNTTISGTDTTSYKYGWLALADLSMMEMREEVYGYSAGATYCATLSFEEKNIDNSFNFDSEQGEKNEIKHDLGTPAAYTGVNGQSISVAPTGSYATEYDKTNPLNSDQTKFAGLLNRENLSNYKNNNVSWLQTLADIEGFSLTDSDESIWEKIADKTSVQPLLIVNTDRTYDGVTRIYNFGYIGANKSFSANSYTPVSVKVKASAGAKAYIYLIDTDTVNNEVMNYNLPVRNFWYDDDGNVLKEEPAENATPAEKQANIAYTLRKDGLYQDTDGKLYANLYNLTKYYDIEFEHGDFFDKDGNRVSFSDLKTGVDYYKDSACTEYAPHYLIAGGINNKVYKFVSGKGDAAVYNYMENGKPNTAKQVRGFNITVATPRYVYNKNEDTAYRFVIDTTTAEGAKYADKWVTVTFYVHTGSVSKNYRLELWSGERDKKFSYDEGADASYVMFDYSNITVDSSSYNARLNAYTEQILLAYRNASGELPDNDLTIADFEALEGMTKSDIFNYFASYYTFSLYDSPSFIPFNAETAEKGKTGYSYSYSDYEENLSFLKVEDYYDDNSLSMSVFIDYSVIDKDIEIIGAPTVDNDTGSTDDKDNNVNIWLLIASIALVVAIFVAIAAILIRYYLKKRGHRKTAGKNSYNFNKNKRYVRKYVKANGEAPAIDVEEGDVDKSLLSDEAEEVEDFEVAEEVDETEEIDEVDNGEVAEEVDETDGDEEAEKVDEADETDEADEPKETDDGEDKE